MRLRIVPTGTRMTPDEEYYEISTADGDTKVVPLDDSAVTNNTVDIGAPVGKDGDSLLVELPRETSDGFWRVYVSRDQLIAA